MGAKRRQAFDTRTQPRSEPKRKKSTQHIYEQSESAKWRDSIEQIIIAIILALLFRTFEAEAFVIPTGSMAPTLQGRHKDITCDKCGYETRAGNSLDGNIDHPVSLVACPICRHLNAIDSDDMNHMSFSGDRILVNKFAYQIAEPKRWDVIVFKNPANPKQNYIKRLVGLPDETLVIRQGNVYTRTEQGDQILRKPPEKIVSLLQEIYNTEFIPPVLAASKWPARWQPASGGNGWTTSPDRRSYQLTPSGDVSWLRYRHIPLNSDFNPADNSHDWFKLEHDQLKIDPQRTQGQLITDFCAYNTSWTSQTQYFFPERLFGWHWVSDLAVKCRAQIRSDQGELYLDAVEAGHHYTCKIDVTTGIATLEIDGGAVEFEGGAKRLTAQTKLKGPGNYRLRFANVDDQLVLWINNKPIPFLVDGTSHNGGYISQNNEHPVWTTSDPGDLRPIGIGGRHLDVTFSEISTYRDIYYIAVSGGNARFEYRGNPSLDEVREHFRNPLLWASSPLFASRPEVVFVQGPDEFFPMGDNSPQSRDARLWHGPAVVIYGDSYPVKPSVRRDRLIGKAFVIYWPHPWRFVIPNFRRMGRIR